MSNKPNEFQTELDKIKAERERLEKKGTSINQFTHEKPEPVDFAAIARELEEKQKKEPEPGANEGYEKTTLYIQQDIYRAYQALTANERGAKKEFANAAFAAEIQRRYQALKQSGGQ